MDILITGSIGFIGFHLSKKLLEAGFNIYGMDNHNNYYDISIKDARLKLLRKFKNYHHHKMDLVDQAFLEDFFSNTKIDLCINLAAQAGVRYSISNPKEYLNSNIIGFFNLLNAIKKINIPIIYASSSSVYGDINCDNYSEKFEILNPKSFYAATKISNEVFASSFCNIYKLSAIGLRFFTVYGPWGRPDMAYFKFVEAAFKEKEIKVYNNGNHFRDFTYVQDIVDAMYKLVKKIGTKYYNNEIFNIGNNRPIALMEFIEIIEDITNKKIKKEFVPKQNGDVLRTAADISKLEKEIGFKPSTNIRNGLDDFIKWYKVFYQVN